MCLSLSLFQWGAAYCVRGGPEKEKAAMEVSLLSRMIGDDLGWTFVLLDIQS